MKMDFNNPHIQSTVAKYTVRNLNDLNDFRENFLEAVDFYCRSMWIRIFSNRLNFLAAAGRKDYEFFIKFDEYYSQDLVKRPPNCYFIAHAVFGSKDEKFIDFFIKFKYLLPASELLFLLTLYHELLDKFEIKLSEEWKNCFMNADQYFLYHLINDKKICEHPDISVKCNKKNFYSPIYLPIAEDKIIFCDFKLTDDDEKNYYFREIIYMNLYTHEDFGMPWFPVIQGIDIKAMKKELANY